MNRDVIISVSGLQFLENVSQDSIETVQQGEYFFRNGSHFLLYDEYLEGFSEPVKNTLRIRDREFLLTKRGLINVQMLFVEGRKNLAQYRTPYGMATFGVDTRKIRQDFGENGGKMEIDYVMDIEHAVVSRNKFQITVRQMGE